MLPTVLLFVGPHHSHLLLPTVTLLRMARSSSPHGLRMISVLVQRDGGIRRTTAAALCYDSLSLETKFDCVSANLLSLWIPMDRKIPFMQVEKYVG